MSKFFTGSKNKPAVLTINLAMIRENFRILQRKTEGKKISAVVKADGYGLGATAVANTLYDAGCTRFFTAHLDEALALRAALPAVEIGVLNGLGLNEMEIYRQYSLLPTLNDLGQIQSWQQYCRAQGPLAASIHIDTGMARLGLPPDEAKILVADRSRLEGFCFRYLMSHMACADSPAHPMNEIQRERFAFHAKAFPEATAMLAASSGTFLGPAWHFDQLRIGASLYGIAPNNKIDNPMKQVVTLQGRILQIREIDASVPVGYGASYIADKKTRVATVAVGYADGYLRSLGNRAVAYFGDRPLPVLGRISMDLMTLDVSDAPAAVPGSMVDLIGPHNDINRLAEDAGTIAYEILTSLGGRYKRRYMES